MQGRCRARRTAVIPGSGPQTEPSVEAVVDHAVDGIQDPQPADAPERHRATQGDRMRKAHDPLARKSFCSATGERGGEDDDDHLRGHGEEKGVPTARA